MAFFVDFGSFWCAGVHRILRVKDGAARTCARAIDGVGGSRCASECHLSWMGRSGCFERAFSPDLVVLPLEPARPGLSGTPRASIFEPETFDFSKILRVINVRCAKRPTSKKHCKNQYETHFGAAVHRTQIDQKSFCVDSEKHSATRTHLTSVLGRSRRTLGASRGRSWSVLGLSWSTPGRPESAPGASRTRPWPFWVRPGCFLRRS